MIIELSGILDLAQVWLAVAFVVFLRVGAAMALFPAVGERSIPVRIRLALAIVFTLLILPSVAPTIPNGGKDPGSLVLSEVVAGLITGSLVRVFVFALEMAGAMTAQVTSLSQIFGGLNADPHPAIGQVLFISGLALAMMLGLHVRLTEMLLLSYDVLPPGKLPDGDVLATVGIERIAEAFRLAFSLAAPFVIASVIYNLAIGVINRAMPQLMVAMVGAPAITGGALVLLAMTAPLILSLWVDSLGAYLDDPFGGR